MRKSAVRGVARLAIAAWIATLGACMAEAPAPEPADELATSTSAVSTADESITSNALEPAATVFECSTTGNWWATREICQAHCAGGTCIACGLSCQN